MERPVVLDPHGVPGPRSRVPGRQSAALTLVFAAVVAAGTATGAWDAAPRAAAAAPGAVRAAAAGDVSGLSPGQARSWVLAHGDRWSAYYSPGQYAGLRQALSGEYVGVGLWVAREADGTIAVSRVQPDTPAAQAGIRPGDRLLRIDGRGVSGLPVTEVVGLLRGVGAPAPAGRAADGGAATGSAVSLTLSPRQARWSVRRVTVRRRLLAAGDVAVDHPAAGTTRIAVQEFSQGSGDEVQAAVHQAAADEPDGSLLLDLRGCAGGLLAEAVEAASAFLDGGPVGTLRTPETTTRLTAEPGGNTRAPLVVLVDSGTMSAAELLAGALQDRGRAVVVGSPTFGKGSVQAPSVLADGSVVERTVAHYTTPSGRSPEGTGIQPDVAVPLSASPAAVERAALAVLGGLRAEQSAADAAQVPQ